MHPLTTFPALLTYQLLAPFLLRVTVGTFGIVAGMSRYKKSYKWTSVFYFLASIFLIIGLYTQIAALAGIIILVCDWYVDNKTKPMIWEQKMLRKLVLVVLISLLFTGPGFFGFDLPL